jgi:hypothetical protein
MVMRKLTFQESSAPLWHYCNLELRYLINHAISCEPELQWSLKLQRGGQGVKQVYATSTGEYTRLVVMLSAC